jgi:membrane-bound lytic murein transglycosylase D
MPTPPSAGRLFRVAVWMPGASLCLLGAAVCLSSCATVDPSPRQFRTFFIPPRPAVTQPQIIDPPEIGPSAPVLTAYANEVPDLTASLPLVPRPSDADFLIKRADDRFASGKRAFQNGRIEDAQRDFDRALEILLTAPENIPDRARLERHAEELVEAIYRYDVDQSGSSPDAEPEVSYDQSPIDDLLNMTFPVDPTLRNKVQDQLRATASQLPLAENDAVVSFINFFSSPRGRKIMAAGLQRSGRYRSMIQRILMEEGVPQELIYLAQAESGFSPRAISRALCVGLWQFAKFRGHEYGLNQTGGTDDRMDPELATRAAARHLHDLYNHFGDWYLAMAAYNCGPGCVDKAIQRTGYADYWELRRLNVLPKETANYVPAILAITIVSKNAPAYGLDALDFERPDEYDTLELESPTHLALLAEATDRPLSELRDLNPSVLRSVAPAGHSIHVPKGSLPQVEAALKAVPAARRDSWRVHRVDAGETLAELAKRFNTTSAAIASANRADDPEAGSWIAIPVAYPGATNSSSARASTKSARATPKPAAKTAATHTPGHAASHRAAAPAHPAAAQHPPAAKAAAKSSPTARSLSKTPSGRRS